MRQPRLAKLLLVAAAATGFAACRTVEVAPLPADADPSAEIDKLEAERIQLMNEQGPVLSPEHYRGVKTAVDDAKKLRSNNAANAKVLDAVAAGRAHAEKARETIRIVETAMPDVVKARRAAIDVRAPEIMEPELKRLDRELTAVTRRIEKGDVSAASNNRDKLVASYNRLEIDVLKKDKLDAARKNIAEAKKEGADKSAPRSLAAATSAFQEAEGFIAQHPRDPVAVKSAADKATTAAERLLAVTREVHAVGGKDRESLVLERERLKTARTSQAEELARQKSELEQTKSALESKERQISSLGDAEAFNERFKAAQAKFTPREAEVYRSGDTLVLRLKGLDFATGQFDIDPSNYELLEKVKEVVANFSPANVLIEGHTDTTGNRQTNLALSDRRAQAVKEYLQVNAAGKDLRMTARGVGDQQPLVPNTSAANRAKNRRVDILITPMAAPAVSH